MSGVALPRRQQLITNNEVDLFSEVGDHLDTRLLAATWVRFAPYHHHERKTVCEDRVRWELTPTAVSDDQVVGFVVGRDIDGVRHLGRDAGWLGQQRYA